ncbi:hypothetical protein BD769DRAFT_1441856 [Suillus cothurnatus]|nr:hypothetical protein BD769DRAFT_1441856 [Suillus cothurnatus]
MHLILVISRVQCFVIYSCICLCCEVFTFEFCPSVYTCTQLAPRFVRLHCTWHIFMHDSWGQCQHREAAKKIYVQTTRPI